MKSMRYLLSFLVLLPMAAHAWWNDEWQFRKKISVELVPDGHEQQVLLRLHAGNFAYFMDMKADGGDLRFMAEDDKTPLKFSVEKFDQGSQMALVWVKLPEGAPLAGPGGKLSKSFWMYYGNANAPAGQDLAGTYGADELAVFSFNAADSEALDSTAYKHNAAGALEKSTAAVIGAGARFSGANSLTVADAPSLIFDPAVGFSLALWVKPQGMQTDAIVLHRGAAGQDITLGIRGNTPYVKINMNGVVSETPALASLAVDQWSHLAVSAAGNITTFYVNGQAVANLNLPLPALAGELHIGGAPGAGFYSGELDELRILKGARSAAEIMGLYRVQAPDANLVALGDDEQNEQGGGESYFVTTMKNVTVDGWVVIGFLAIMAVVAGWVMVAKSRLINSMRRESDAFITLFRAHTGDLISLQDKLDPNAVDASPLYQVFNVGVSEVQARVGRSLSAAAAALADKNINAIRAALDAEQIRQSQRMNGQMVLLTIAISGGPFLGLLGTVVGVMITFAAIAASGDVNVNAIAPGIAASLAATVAGLAVAIPALFGYNYLGARIKEVSADMHVFTDELIGRIAEQYGQ